MEIKFCPICASILEIIPMDISGTTSDFWVCPEGDWEDPVEVNRLAGQEQENGTPPSV